MRLKGEGSRGPGVCEAQGRGSGPGVCEAQGRGIEGTTCV